MAKEKRELPVLFGQKRMYPENNSGRECCWPHLIGQHPLSPVFGQKRPGTSGNSYFAQLLPVFDHFMLVSAGLLDYSNRSTWATRTIVVVVVVVVVFTLKAVPISTQYFLTSVLVQLTRTPSVVTG